MLLHRSAQFGLASGHSAGIGQRLRTIGAALPDTDELRPRLEVCVNVFVKGKVIVSLQRPLGKH